MLARASRLTRTRAMFYASPGVVVRLTRNVDKDRGYVNGAVGVVRRVLSRDESDIPTVFTVELSTGVHILVHPIYDKKRCFLPCTYGYATTIRRAQGATYYHGCLWFDHIYPPEKGLWLCRRKPIQEQIWHLSIRENSPDRLAPCPRE